MFARTAAGSLARIAAPLVTAGVALSLLGCTPGPTPDPTASASVDASPTPVEPGPGETTPAPEPTPSDDTIDRDVVLDNVRDAVTSGDTAALASWMADSVDIALAATEAGGTVGPDEAAAFVHDSFTSTTTEWDFDLDPATIADYADGDYAVWFPPTVIVGRTIGADPMVIAITVPSDRITAVLIAIEDVLYF